MPPSNDEALTQQLQRTITRYFDALYHCDLALMHQIFHPDARYINAQDEPPVIWDMPSYFAVVAKRTSPASKGESRDHEAIVQLQWSGPKMAFATLHCAIAPRYFTDYLTFIHQDSRWQIIAKVFTYSPLPNG